MFDSISMLYRSCDAMGASAIVNVQPVKQTYLHFVDIL